MYIKCPCCSKFFDTERDCTPLESPFTVKSIIEMSAQAFNLPDGEIYLRRRTKEIVAARHVAMWLILRYCNDGFSEIGRVFGLDRTTVMHGEERVENAIFTQTDVYETVMRLNRWMERASQPMLKAV